MRGSEFIYLLEALLCAGWLGGEPAPCTCPAGGFWFTVG
jgi:hypothetical protein